MSGALARLHAPARCWQVSCGCIAASFSNPIHASCMFDAPRAFQHRSAVHAAKCHRPSAVQHCTHPMHDAPVASAAAVCHRRANMTDATRVNDVLQPRRLRISAAVKLQHAAAVPKSPSTGDQGDQPSILSQLPLHSPPRRAWRQQKRASSPTPLACAIAG